MRIAVRDDGKLAAIRLKDAQDNFSKIHEELLEEYPKIVVHRGEEPVMVIQRPELVDEYDE